MGCQPGADLIDVQMVIDHGQRQLDRLVVVTYAQLVAVDAPHTSTRTRHDQPLSSRWTVSPWSATALGAGPVWAIA